MTETSSTSLTMSIIGLCGAIAFLIFVIQGRKEMSPAAGCPLATPERVPAKTPKDFPPVGSYYIGQDARCNAYGKCVAEDVRNSCAPTREERLEKMTFVFDALACGGYNSDHTELQVYPDGTCLFVGNCRPCPGR